MKLYLLKNIRVKANYLLLKESFFCMIFSFIIIGIILLVGINLSFFNPFKNAFQDFSYLDLYNSQRLNQSEQGLNENIVLVNIDRLNRKDIAELIHKIKQSEPRVIGLDVVFKEKKDSVWDAFLAKELSSEAIVTTYTILNEKEIVSNQTIFGNSRNQGYSNFNFEKEAIVIREFQGIKKENSKSLVSFPVMVAKKYQGVHWPCKNDVYLQKKRPINYFGNREAFLILEKQDIMNQDKIFFVKDKIVLVGYLGDAIHYKNDIEDKHYTPMNSKFVGKSPPDTFGLIIHANIIQMILTENYIRVIPSWFLWFLGICLTYIALMYFIKLINRDLASYVLRLKIVQLLFIVILLWFSLFLFKKGILLKISYITAAVVFSIGLIGFYKKLAQLLYNKFKWEGYFYHD